MSNKAVRAMLAFLIGIATTIMANVFFGLMAMLIMLVVLDKADWP